MNKFFIHILSLILFSGVNPLFSQTTLNNETIEKIDKIYTPIISNNNPGASILISKSSNIIYKKNFGKANIEMDVDVKSNHLFRIGSNTKPFTVCAILILAQKKKLSLQDDITKYIIDYPTKGHKITIEHLLTHTSGIKDFNAIRGFRKNGQTDFTPIEFIDLFKNEPLDFEPGTNWKYSNSGYFLLGYIIEKVSGKTYSDFLETNIFSPLKMENTTYDNSRKIIKGRVDGYVPIRNGYLNGKYITTSYPFAAGSLLSTVEELNIFYSNLFSYKIISKTLLDKAITPFILKNGTQTPTGYGWFLGNIAGNKIIEHSGGITGFYSSIVYAPKEKLFFTALTNCNWNNFDFENATKKGISVLLDANYFNTLLSLKELREYEGIYQFEDKEIAIIEEGGRLIYVRKSGGKFNLYPFGKNQIYNEIELSTYSIKKDKGKIVGIKVQRFVKNKFYSKTKKKLPKKSIYLTIKKTTFKNVDKGIKQYKKLKKENEEGYTFNNPNELNKLGYDLLFVNKTEDAIKIFNVLTNEFPKNANAFDSLGEAYFKNKDFKLSLLNYQKSYELDANNKNAIKMIEKLKKKIVKI